MMQIINESTGSVIATTVWHANSFLTRLKGLLGHSQLSSDQALVLEPCSSVHSCFMRFAIDIVFIDKQNKVIHLQENLIPWRFSPVISKARTVIELPVGSIEIKGISLGTTLLFRHKEVK